VSDERTQAEIAFREVNNLMTAFALRVEDLPAIENDEALGLLATEAHEKMYELYTALAERAFR
jgi:hypothetical protein